MKISDLVKELNKAKKEHGDIEVLVNAKAFKHYYENGEGFMLEELETTVDKIPKMNMDTLKISKRKYPTLIIRPYDYTE